MQQLHIRLQLQSIRKGCLNNGCGYIFKVSILKNEHTPDSIEYPASRPVYLGRIRLRYPGFIQIIRIRSNNIQIEKSEFEYSENLNPDNFL